MSAYVVVEVEIDDPHTYEEYRKAATPAVEAYGGRFLVRGGRVETLEGGWSPGRFVIIEFENAARARAWWSSEEYRLPKSLRQKAARSKMILVEGV